MHAHALPMSEASYGSVPELLQQLGIRVEPHQSIGQFQMLRCERDGAGVLLSVTRPAHWQAADDERRDKVMVAAIGESLFRFWRFSRETRLAREIISVLRPLEWHPC